LIKDSNYSGNRFYPVVKEAKRVDALSGICKRKTRYSQNPPIECHVGWVLDDRNTDQSPPKYEQKSSNVTNKACNSNRNSFSATGTTPINESNINSAIFTQSQDLAPFQHPSYSLLKQNGFTQQLYSKFRKRCLVGT
jgi:la-related protein 1